MSGSILLTGATGFLGMELLARLIDRGEQHVVVLIRADSDRGARERLASVLERLYDEPPPAAARVLAVRGELCQPGLGLSAEDRRWLCGSVDRIVHCAASISFSLPIAQAREINVEGVRRVIELARETAACGGLQRLLHVSTAYVSGQHAGSFGEQDLDLGQAFRNSYEHSKNEAEQLLMQAADLPSVIARPSMVVGHRASGWTPAFNVIYWPLRAYERGLLTEIPARGDSVVDFVPIDYVGAGLEVLLDHEDARGTYALVAGEHALSAGELVGLLSSIPQEAAIERQPVRLVAPRHGVSLPVGAESLLPYFDVRCRFLDNRASGLLGPAGVAGVDPRGYLWRLIEYARTTRWGKRPLSRQASLAAATGT